MEYKIITGDEYWLVEQDINTLLEKGYKLYGGLVVASSAHCVYNYTQAMIKED